MPLVVIKGSFKIYFQEMEKLLLMDRIFEILKQRGFHYPENPFPLARVKNLFQNYVSTGRKKMAEMSLAEMSKK